MPRRARNVQQWFLAFDFGKRESLLRGAFMASDVVNEIREHLHRLGAERVRVELDPRFEPKTGTLLKVEDRGANWHMFPVDFRTMLERMPDRAGADAVHRAIETEIAHLWHGPSSKGSRDTSG